MKNRRSDHVDDLVHRVYVEVMETRCSISQPHCENCGSTDPEDVNRHANDGYSSCCNEIISADHTDCRNFHGGR